MSRRVVIIFGLLLAVGCAVALATGWAGSAVDALGRVVSRDTEVVACLLVREESAAIIGKGDQGRQSDKAYQIYKQTHAELLRSQFSRNMA